MIWANMLRLVLGLINVKVRVHCRTVGEAQLWVKAREQFTPDGQFTRVG